MITVITASVIVIIAAWLPNFGLIGDTITNNSLSLGNKLSILVALAGSINTNFNSISRTMIIVSAILGGVQVSLVLYYLRHKVLAGKEAGMGIVGIVSSLLGVGCASCGSVVITSVIGLGATSSVIAMLPWHGVEFAVVGLLIILFSVIMTAKKLYETQFCELKS